MYFRELKQLLILAAPLVLAQLAHIATSFVDTLMVGRLGNESLAGIAVGSVVYMLVSIVLSGVVLGVSAVVSQATGAGDKATCGRAVRQGFLLAALMWIPAMLLFWNIEPVLHWLQQPEATAALSGGYLRAISWGLLPALMAFSLRGLLEGIGNTRPIMVIMILGVVLNVVANHALMFGHYGLPRLGLIGTGYASSLVLTSNFVLLLMYCTRTYPDLGLLSRVRIYDAEMARELLRIGGPIGLTLAFEASMFTAAAIAMGTLGKLPLAAHQIVMQVASVAFMVPLGIGIATSVRVGQNIGGGRPQEARRSGFVGIATAGIVMIFFGLLFWIAPAPILGLFLDVTDPTRDEVLRYGTRFLMIAGLFQVVDGVQVAANLALRGLKDTFAAMVLTLISYWGVGCVVGGWLCWGAGLEGTGLWLGMTAGLAAAAVCLVIRFFMRVDREIRDDPGESEPMGRLETAPGEADLAASTAAVDRL